MMDMIGGNTVLSYNMQVSSVLVTNCSRLAGNGSESWVLCILVSLMIGSEVARVGSPFFF